MVAKAIPLHPSWHGTCFRRLSHKVGISQTWKKRAQKFKSIIAKQALHMKMLRSQIFSQTSHQERCVANSTSARKDICGEERFDFALPTDLCEAPSAHTDAQGQQACIQSKASMDLSTDLEIHSTPHLEFLRSGQLWADVSDSEESAKQMRTLKLRGLPFLPQLLISRISWVSMSSILKMILASTLSTTVMDAHLALRKSSS